MIIRVSGLAGLLVLLATVGARADPPPDSVAPAPTQIATVRTGNHEMFGRVVIDLPPGVTASASADGPAGVRVHVAGGTLAGSGRAPRYVAAVNINGAELELALAPDTHFTTARLSRRLVIDVFPDAQPARKAAAKPGATASVAPVAPTEPPAPTRHASGHRFSGPPPRPTPARATTTSEPGPKPAPAPPTSAPASVALPADMAATNGPEPLRMPLQRLLEGNIPRVLLPPPPTPPATPPVAAAPPGGASGAPGQQVASSPPAAPNPPMSPGPSTASGPSTAPDPQTAPVTAVESSTLPAPGRPPGGAGPLAIAAQGGGRSLLLPFAASTGAAAFQRDGETVVVFDERRPLDLAGLRGDPAFAATFGAARVQLLPQATVLRMTVPGSGGLALSHTAEGWTLAPTTHPVLEPIRGDVVDGAMRLLAAAPGQVVSVPDPQTGGALLVGTQTKPGQGIPIERRTPDFTLLPTMQGVVVDPASDALTLQVAPAKQPPGFVLAAAAAPGGTPGGPGVALDPPGPEGLAALAAARMTRRWDIPALPTEALLRRLQAATEAAAAAPPQGRTAGRIQAMQAMLALGMGAEADALGNLIVADDARAADQPDLGGLTAVAALLGGRLTEADAITDPRLDGSDEVALWRAVRLAMLHEGSPAAAAGFAATLPLLLAYPSALRERLLPLAAETMVQGGEREGARRLLDARKNDGSLDYARGLLAELDGHAAPALALYDRLAQSPDRKLRAHAAERAAELRLKTGLFTAAQTADTLDKLIYAWRGGPWELALRLRVAALRTQSGNWRAALALLRETGASDMAQAWPDAEPTIRARMGEVFAQALAQDARAALPPLELVSLLEENPDLLPGGEPGRALAARLADRLVALDLPERATPVLEKLMKAAAPGPARAEFGARLAALRLDQKDPTGALAALSDSAATGLPAAVTEARTITFARATAARGALPPAVAALASLDTPAADEARAALLEQARDWPGAVAALASYAQKAVPPDGKLAEAPAQLLLRLASAAAQAGDETLLTRLRDRELPRMPAGKLADMFRLLTERPVQGIADLPRAAQEMALARELPAALKTLAGGPPLP